MVRKWEEETAIKRKEHYYLRFHLCVCHGFMSAKLNSSDIENTTSFQFFEAGKNRDGWFTNKDLVEQLHKCAPLFKHFHPDTDIHVFFDNSMTHRARAPDGLDATRPNNSDGGKNKTVQRPGWFIRINPDTGLEERVEQSMVLEDGTPKDLATILKERGKHLNHDGTKLLVKKCMYCKNLLTRDEMLVKSKRPGVTEDNVGSYPCCMEYVLSNEPDFSDQEAWLVEETKKLGFECNFFPKYHCELVWGWIKSYHRRTCTYKYADLKRELPITLLERLPLAFVRRAARKCERYMNVYRRHLDGPLLEFAVKKYSSHRCIPQSVENFEIEKEYTDQLSNRTKRKRSL